MVFHLAVLLELLATEPVRSASDAPDGQMPTARPAFQPVSTIVHRYADTFGCDLSDSASIECWSACYRAIFQEPHVRWRRAKHRIRATERLEIGEGRLLVRRIDRRAVKCSSVICSIIMKSDRLPAWIFRFHPIWSSCNDAPRTSFANA